MMPWMVPFGSSIRVLFECTIFRLDSARALPSTFCLVVAICLGLSSSARADWETDRRAALQSVFARLGAELHGPQRIPITGFMQGVIDDLTAAQRRTTHRNVVVTSHLHIIESSAFNAFVLSLKPQAEARQENHVFVTTGMLRELLDLPSPLTLEQRNVLIQERLKILTGILGHEMGHPVDGVANFSIAATHRWGKQLIELRADADGTFLLREAGYPHDAIHAAKDYLIIRARENAARDALTLGTAYISTHPNLPLNQALNRVLLTGLRLKQGKANEQAFQQRLNGLNLSQIADTHLLPAGEVVAAPPTLTQAMSDLDRALAYSEENRVYNERFPENQQKAINRALLLLDDKLLERERGKNPVYSETERAELLRLFRRLLTVDAGAVTLGGIPYDAEDIRENFGTRNPGSVLSDHLPHSLLVERIRFFQTPEFLNLMAELGGRDSDIGGTSRPEHVVGRYTPARDYYRLLPQMSFRITEPSSIDERRDIDEYRGLFSHNHGHTLEQILAAGEFLQKSILINPDLGRPDPTKTYGQLTPEALSDRQRNVRFLLFQGFNLSRQDGSESYFPGLMLHLDLEPTELERARNRTLEYLNANPEVRESYVKTARFFWENRGAFSVLSSFREGQVDWGLVANLLNLPTAGLTDQVEQATRDFIDRSPEFAKLMNALEANRITPAYYLEYISPARRLMLQRMLNTTNPHVAAAQSWVRQYARQALAMDSPASFRPAFEETFRNDLRDRAAELSLLPAHEAIATLQKDVLKNLALDPGFFWLRAGEFSFADVVARTIANSSLSSEKKREWLSSIFLQHHPEIHRNDVLGFSPASWVLSPDSSPTQAATVAEVLRSHGLLGNSPGAVLNSLKAIRASMETTIRNLKIEDGNARNHLIDIPFERTYGGAIDALADEILREISRVGQLQNNTQKIGQLMAIVDLLDLPRNSDGTKLDFRSHRLTDIQAAILREAERTTLTLNERLLLFTSLTNVRPSSATDAYYRTHIQPHLGDSTLTSFENVLYGGNIASRKYRAELARAVVEPEVQRLSGGHISHTDLTRLMEQVRRALPDVSLDRDQLVEDTAWRLRLSSPSQLNYIESLKSTNPFTISPHLVRFGSVISEALLELDETGRRELLIYLLDPLRRTITPALDKSLREAKQRVMNRTNERLGRTVALTEEGYLELKDLLVRSAEDSSPWERLPIFDVLLNLGERDSTPANSQSTRRRLLQDLLGINPTSPEGIRLLTFLELAPPHERSVALSWMMAFHPEQKGTLLDLFSAFGFPGARAGQESILWGLIDKKYRGELEDLFDRVPAGRTLKEVHELLRERFPHQNFRVLRRLGNGSTSDVIEVEWDEPIPGGQRTKKAALLIRRPYANEQLEAQYAFGKEYVRRLGQQGLHSDAAFVDALVEAQHEQMQRELNFNNVAQNLRQLRASIEGSNGRNGLAATLAPGINVRVPRVYSDFGLHEDILFMEVAPGTTFHRIPEALRQQVATPLAQLLVGSVFRGTSQGNPSPGNVHVEDTPGRPTVWIIDGGQVGTLAHRFFGADEQLRFAQFLKAVFDKNASDVITRATQLGGKLGPNANRRNIEIALEAVLNANTAPHDTFRAVLNVLTAHGVAPDARFTLTGGLKPLLELYHAGIAPQQTIAALVAGEVHSTLIRRPVPLLTDWLSRRASSLGRGCMEMLEIWDEIFSGSYLVP